ncbi:hypothetical protein FRC12_025093 [Ceratobasidium sp. 428]|nr:hypothetical protein FRC12_025093 [Ceratobasidium sp. 428]
MVRLPALEYSLTHPHPRGQWFLLATIIVFMLTLPILVLVNLATVGSELVPSLQPTFQPNDTLMAGWWGNNRLPPRLRPKTPNCEPKDLGRGDTFRLSGSLFDYTVMSTWNTSEPPSASRVQEQKRAEYRGQSFSDCYVNTTRVDFSMVEETQTVTCGVICPGTKDYPIFVSMETKVVFALELTKDFIGQYYGPGLDLLSLPDANPSDYRKLVLAVLEVISTDSLTLIGKPLLSSPALSMSVFLNVNNVTNEVTLGTTTFTYLNGTRLLWPLEARIYGTSITNLAQVVNHAVNLDLGNQLSPNIFRNTSVLKHFVLPNLAPSGITPDEWIGNETQSFYYDKLPPKYQTWAQALLDEYPVRLGNVTNLPSVSEMTTSYLCPMYKVKPISALLSSVFVGSATMTLSVWGIWMFLTAFLAKRIMAPRKWSRII